MNGLRCPYRHYRKLRMPNRVRCTAPWAPYIFCLHNQYEGTCPEAGV